MCRMFFAVGFGVLSLSIFAGRGPAGENIQRKAWTCTPEAEKLLAKWKTESKAYRPASERTAIFARAQLKYGAERSDFLHAWYERPLHQNTSWQGKGTKAYLLNEPAWYKTVEAVRLGKMDGLGVCISQSGRSEVIGRSVLPGAELPVLVELPYGYHDGGIDKYLDVAAKALAMPNAYRIDGKVVLTRYPKVREGDLDKAAAFRKALDERFGKDKFIVIYYVGAFEKGLPHTQMTPEALVEAREYLRKVLRKTDGIFMAGWEVYWPRRYGAKFEREVIAPLLQSVLSEPEFAGKKYLGMPICFGHENYYRWAYSIDSTGTELGTERLETMTTLRPDFVLCCEWDEENENTHVRPTVSNGYVHQRILRHFADKWAGRPFEVFPGDDTSIPNLILSYRKTLIAGEPIEVEVRNIPDGTFAGKEFSVSIRWRNRSGKVVKRYPAQKLSSGCLDSAWFVSFASEFAAERTLVPEIVVEWEGGRYEQKTGFWPLDITASRTVDFKWVKQALREQPKGVKGRVAAGTKDTEGMCTVSGVVSSPVKLRSIEVLDGPDTVYMYDPQAKDRKGIVSFRLEFQGHDRSNWKVSGGVRMRNTPGAELKKVAAHERTIKVEKDGWTFTNTVLCNWPKRMFAYVPENEVANGVIEVDLSPVFKGSIRLADVMKKDAVGIAGPAGGNFVVLRYINQESIPPHCNVKNAKFSFSFKPLHKASVLRLQTIDENDRVWRSEPFTFYSPSGRKKTFHVYERDSSRVTELSLDENLVDEPSYDFGDERGSVLYSPAGRGFWGIMGGRVPQVTGFGTGESGYGNIVTQYVLPTMKDWEDSAPTRVEGPDGGKALHFKGCESAHLPQQVIPAFAGFEIEFMVKPDTVAGKQALLGSGACGLEIHMENGVVNAAYFIAERYANHVGAIVKAYGPERPLVPGRWSKVRVTFDQREFRVEVDGVSGKVVQASGYQHNPRYTAIGAANRHLNWYRGAISNLKFKLR